MAAPVLPHWRRDRPALRDTIVCDGLLPWTRTFLPPGAKLAEQLHRFHDNGCDHVSLTAAAGNDDAADALTCIGWLRRELASETSWIAIASTEEDIRAAKNKGKLSVSLHFQTATPFAADLDLVDAFYSAGIRRAILAYNEANIFADGCHEPRNGGLTARGRELVRRMDETGMIIDLSHCGARTTFDVMEMDLSRPPIFSHSNAHALFDHERNISDDQIKTCTARGGYIGVNGVGIFLDAPESNVPAAMARHAAHIANIAGADRVGLGIDFMFLEDSDYAFYHQARQRWPRGYPEPPWHFFQPEQFETLIVALEAEGFNTDELSGILGGNYLRLAI